MNLTQVIYSYVGITVFDRSMCTCVAQHKHTHTHTYREQHKTLLRLHLDALKEIGTSKYKSNEVNAILMVLLQGKKNTLFPVIRNNKMMDT